MAKTHSEAFTRLVDQARREVQEHTVDDIRRRQVRGETFHLVDVREDGEWASGHLPGAVHIGKGVIERDIESVIPDKDADIVLYCGGGFRSVLAAKSLAAMGYTRVSSMDGGWRGWNEAGHPTVTPGA